MVGMGFSMRMILREIKKCIVLCANCHCIEHYEEEESVGLEALFVS
jgi:predicted HNH restriction endonuclease